MWRLLCQRKPQSGGRPGAKDTRRSREPEEGSEGQAPGAVHADLPTMSMADVPSWEWPFLIPMLAEGSWGGGDDQLATIGRVGYPLFGD